jgi:hypothetical protein
MRPGRYHTFASPGLFPVFMPACFAASPPPNAPPPLWHAAQLITAQFWHAAVPRGHQPSASLHSPPFAPSWSAFRPPERGSPCRSETQRSRDSGREAKWVWVMGERAMEKPIYTYLYCFRRCRFHAAWTSRLQVHAFSRSDRSSSTHM